MTLDKDKILRPSMIISQLAQKQINLMAIHDFTIKDKVLRIEVSGKDCDGFNFDIGLTTPRYDDFLIPIMIHDQSPGVEDRSTSIHVALSPFAAFYLPEFELDYKHGHLPDEEGFIVKSRALKEYQGKFWKKNAELIPPTADGQKNPDFHQANKKK